MSTAVIAERPLTYEEERGKPMPSKNHAIIQGNLYAEFRKHREFRIVPEVRLELAPGFPKTPDLSVYPRGDMDLDVWHDEIHLTSPPLLTVEIVSPIQGMQEIMDKVKFYLVHGVKSVWVVVPPLQQVSIFLPDNSFKNVDAGVAQDPATGLTANLAEVFS